MRKKYHPLELPAVYDWLALNQARFSTSCRANCWNKTKSSGFEWGFMVDDPMKPFAPGGISSECQDTPPIAPPQAAHRASA
jgi:hypothetical protein